MANSRKVASRTLVVLGAFIVAGAVLAVAWAATSQEPGVAEDSTTLTPDGRAYTWLMVEGERATEVVALSPLRLRNTADEPVVIEDIELLDVTNVIVEEVSMIGPQSPSVFQQFLQGPEMAPGGAVEDLDPQPATGFVIAAPDGSPPPEDLGDRSPGADHQNHGSVLVKFRLADPSKDGNIQGIRVLYRVGDSETLRFVRDDRSWFGLCQAHVPPNMMCAGIPGPS